MTSNALDVVVVNNDYENHKHKDNFGDFGFEEGRETAKELKSSIFKRFYTPDISGNYTW